MARRAPAGAKRPASLRRFSILLAIYLIFASGIAATLAHVIHNRSMAVGQPVGLVTNVGPATPKYLVLMVLDGARPDYFNMTSLPHVDQLRADGTQYTRAFAGILEAETPSGHAAISSGSRPDHMGILGFDWGNDGSQYSLFSPDKMTTLLQIMKDSGTPSLAGSYKKAYPSAKVVALSGHKYYAAAPLGGPDADAIMYYEGDPKGRYVPVSVPGHTPPAGVLNAPGLIYPTTTLKNGVEDGLATNLALSAVHNMQPRMLLINYPEFDWPLGHVDGGSMDRAAVITDMQQFDSDLGRIEDTYRKAGILNQTLFVITADHGMMPITRFVPATTISNAVTQAGARAPDIASNSGDYIWLDDASKAQAVAQNILAAKDTSIQSVYYLSSSGGQPSYVEAGSPSLSQSEEAANQYLLSGMINGHEPAVVVFGNEGISFSDPKTNWKADHGGNSWQSQNMPLILAGPGIRSGVVSNAPAQLDDIAPTVLADMGVQPTGMEGQVLTDALIKHTSDTNRARVAEIAQLGRVASALIGKD